MTFEAIGIVSEDVAKSVAFYRLLGIDLKKMGDHDHYDGVATSGVRFMIDSVALIQGFEPTFKKTRGTGMALCFNQGSAKGVDSMYATLTSAGGKSIKPPWDAFWGQRYACVADPDGYQIDLFAPL